MACYDCENCNNHKSRGGKCEKFEYNCPYDLVKNVSKSSVSQIHQYAIIMQKILTGIDFLDEEGALNSEISLAKDQLEDIIEKSSEKTIKEWEEVNRENN